MAHQAGAESEPRAGRGYGGLFYLKTGKKANQRSFPRWLFVLLAIGGLLASGIYIGVMSVAGFAYFRLLLAIGYGVFGLVMFWGALHSR